MAKNIKEYVVEEVTTLINRKKQRDHRDIVKEYTYDYVMFLNENLYETFFEYIIEETDYRGCISSYIACKYADHYLYEGTVRGDEAMEEYLEYDMHPHCAMDYLDETLNTIKTWKETKHLSDHIDGIIDRFKIFKQHTVGHIQDDNCHKLRCNHEHPEHLWGGWGCTGSPVRAFVFPSLYQEE